MRKAKFIVPGHALGYKTTTYNGRFSKGYSKYVEYKRTVQQYARMAGFKLPLKSTEERQIMVSTIVYFRNRIHADPENVNKGIRDALFYDEKRSRGKKSGKGDDKQTGGYFTPPRYSKSNPRVIVFVYDYVRKKRNKK